MDEFSYEDLISNLNKLSSIKNIKDIERISKNLGNYTGKGHGEYDYGKIGEEVDQILSHLNQFRLYSISPSRKYNIFSKRELQISKDRSKILLEEIGSRRKFSKLETYSKVAAIIGIIGAGVFFLPNLTGNVIADLSTNTISWIGVVLLTISLIAGFFWIKSKKSMKDIQKKKK